jgi:hypothetical protein
MFEHGVVINPQLSRALLFKNLDYNALIDRLIAL